MSLSDALTDINRDFDRAELVEKALERLVEYLVNPSDEAKSVLFETAKKADDIEGGYWGSKTRLLPFLRKNLGKLLSKDETVWATLLLMAYGFPRFTRLKKISPIREKVMLVADYGYGFVNFIGEFEDAISDLISRHGYPTYQGKGYLILLPQAALKNANVVPFGKP